MEPTEPGAPAGTTIASPEAPPTLSAAAAPIASTPASTSGPEPESPVEQAPVVDAAGPAPRAARGRSAPAAPNPEPASAPRIQPATDPDRSGCTAPQLRRFIKSRTYVPMHELRRRFGIEGDDDDVTPVDFPAGSRVFVGLPNREGRLLGELFRAGDVGYELSLDPISPIVVGVFPMRPVPRG